MTVFVNSNFQPGTFTIFAWIFEQSLADKWWGASTGLIKPANLKAGDLGIMLFFNILESISILDFAQGTQLLSNHSVFSSF